MRFTTTWSRNIFSARGQQWLAVALVVLCLLPFVVLAFDSHPALDDFQDAVMRRRLGFWAAQRELYQGWTGRYTTSLLLMDASPLHWGPHWYRYYFLVGWSALLALAGGLYACWTVLTGAAWPRRVRLLATGVVLALWLTQAASIAEGLYWYNAVAVYTWPAALLLWWLVALVQLVRTARSARGSMGRGLVAATLTVAVVGSNEVAALVVLAGLGYAALWAWCWHRPRLPALAALLTIALLAAAASFLAPGNGQRLNTIAHQPQLLQALVGSGAAAAYFSVNWLGAGLLLAATALALPALARLIARPGSAAHGLSRVPPLWLGTGLLLVLALVNMPSYWATGGMMPLRVRAVVWLFFLVGWLALALAALGAASQRWPLLRHVAAGWPRPVAAALWAGLLLFFFTDHNVRLTHAGAGVASNNVVLAYRDWLSGAAARYNQQQRARYRQLQAAPAQSLRLAPLTAEPPTLIYYDITTDSTYWGNSAYAQFFGQRTVWIGPGGHAPPR